MTITYHCSDHLTFPVALAWKYRRWRQNRKTPASSLVKSPGSEKKVLWPKSSLRKKLELDASRAPKINAVVLPPVPPTPDEDAGWVPRVTPWRPPSMPRPKTLFLPSVLAEAGRLTPPPNYYVANGGVPSPSSSMVKTPMPSPLGLPLPPPPAARKLNEKPNIPAPLRLKVTPPTPSLVPEPAVESPSPRRTDSLKPFNSEAYEKLPGPGVVGSSIFTHSRSGSSGSSGSISRHPYHAAHRQKKKKLPRLVTVILDFTPSLADELAIKAGDTVRLLAEYEDQWCLVQQVGKADSQKGAVPQFCVQDRQDMIPTPQSSSFFPLTHSRSRSSINSFSSIV